MASIERKIATVRSTLCFATLAAGMAMALVSPLAAAELVMFEEPGCPWCERWRTEVGVAFANSSEGKRAPLRRVALSRARDAGVDLAAPIVVSPTFVLVDQGREIGRITGYPGADFFWGLLAGLFARLGPEG